VSEHHEESEAEYAEFDQIETEEEIDGMIEAGEETVLVRIVEWTEWIPGEQSEHSRDLIMNQGWTGVRTGKTERLLEVAVTGTGMNRRVRIKHADSDSETVVPYSLYAFQAVLAQNVSEQTFETLMAAQRPPDEAMDGKKIVVTKHMPENPPPPPPKRRARRKR